MHELGHHLLAISEEWCFVVAPALAKAGKDRAIEELLASTFAARTLIPDTLAKEAFARGVTSTAVAKLASQTQASSTACLVRALAEPGERLVILAQPDGTPWFAQTTGTPYAPSIRVRQPSIETAATRANQGSGTFHLTGSHGLRFASGNVNPHVSFDVTVRGGLVYVVVESTRPDSRLRTGSDGWQLDCLAGCGHTFTASEAGDPCSACSEAFCPRCRGCECRRARICERCTLALPAARERSGQTICEDCE